MGKKLWARLADVYASGAIDIETHVISLNIKEVEEIVKVHDKALSGLHQLWGEPDRDAAYKILHDIQNLKTQ